METRGDGMIWRAMTSLWRNRDVRRKEVRRVSVSHIVNVNREQIKERNKRSIEYVHVHA